jgi:hypothetical protein
MFKMTAVILHVTVVIFSLTDALYRWNPDPLAKLPSPRSVRPGTLLNSLAPRVIRPNSFRPPCV